MLRSGYLTRRSSSLVHLIDWYKSFMFGLFSFGQSFSHHSSSLFCCLIEFWVFLSSFRSNVLWSRHQSQPQYGRSRLPMARCSFGSSLYNVLTPFTDGFFSISFLYSGIQGPPRKLAKFCGPVTGFCSFATLLAGQSVTIFLTIQWLLRRAHILSFASLQMILPLHSTVGKVETLP